MIALFGAIEGLKAWAFYIEEAEGVIRVRIRSKGPVINDVAAKYNGGGHPLAAGATVQTWEEAERITKDLEADCQAYVYKTCGPVRTVRTLILWITSYEDIFSITVHVSRVRNVHDYLSK